jgi:hypothetical protein
MPEKESGFWLANWKIDQQPKAEDRGRARAAANCVAARAAGLSQQGALLPATQDLLAYFTGWRGQPAAKDFIEEGWQVGVADITLPVAKPELVRLQFDHGQQAWVFTTPNPNPGITGKSNGEAQPGLSVFGFMVAITPSFMQVAEYQGRYFLWDGYHRAYGLMRAGANRVPVIYRKYSSLAELDLPGGLFPLAVFLGERPPRLSDYLDDDVSAQVSISAAQRMIVIQGMEFSAGG